MICYSNVNKVLFINLHYLFNKIKHVSFVVLVNISVCNDNNLFGKYEMYKYTYIQEQCTMHEFMWNNL